MDHDALIREIEATIAVCGASDTARALGTTPRKLRAILRGGAILPELVERATAIGLVPASRPTVGGSPKI
ncbi:hypothetical protein BE20_25030 [Sorangium cellulosum]|uniref:DNA-binding protein n=1 Tax=Sorangium cellulosum TaxID=56 RepID=A0A150S9U0_SORCE|nr:hypothetical protein BE20_25030 [Sorangium cellulosum]KYF89254.1 hypothetical protein BE18_22740 [Sorangium cellulosum]